ncbi:MAG: SGNH/GDSL hydrolase family protein [Anaerolineae bacterium]
MLRARAAACSPRRHAARAGIDQGMKDRCAACTASGKASGKRADADEAVGDSLTTTRSSLARRPRWTTLDAYGDLQPVIDHYLGGWRSSARARDDRLQPEQLHAVAWRPAGRRRPCSGPSRSRAECPPPDDYLLACELKPVQPRGAVILFGTNAENEINVDYFESTLRRIVDELAAKVPLLTTIPPRLDKPRSAARVTWYNQAVSVAQGSQVPLINLGGGRCGGRTWWNAGSPATASTSNAFGAGPANFTPAGLRYGMNQRNLITLQALARLKRVVFDDGPPEP